MITINHVNIALMIISLVFAYIVPFELFLFSYAILGPLHYLTEISWLEKRNYFVKSKSDALILFLVTIIIMLAIFGIFSPIKKFSANLLFIAFIYALVAIFVEKISLKIVIISAITLCSVVFDIGNKDNILFTVFAIWLPTIIHVFLFTGSFILLGALREKSISGILSLLIFIFCGLVCFLYIPESITETSEYGKRTYDMFKNLNISLYEFMGFGNFNSDQELYSNSKSIAIMRFIAFAYSYHYLNWFSKTTVIKWNEVSFERLAVIFMIWILSIILYVADYKTGFIFLLFLSILHVILEFPLNHRVFIEISKEFKKFKNTKI